jgi:hydrogenase nickel incorporation protein HypA/HybF
VHELSLCQAIVDTVREHAGKRQIRCVHVRIGYFRQVVPESLLFSWQVMTDGTELANCELSIEHVPAVIVCQHCGGRSELDRPLLVCPSCEGHSVDLVQGEEFQISSMDVTEEVV